jgi:hypothetical protein
MSKSTLSKTLVMQLLLLTALRALALNPGWPGTSSPERIFGGSGAEGSSGFYETPGLGIPNHISVGYSRADPVVLRRQMTKSQVQWESQAWWWIGNGRPREPFLDRSVTPLMQSIAPEKQFKVAMR